MKVCPHCAEELPDETTVCPHCHNDPAVLPDWARPERDPTFWRSEGASEPDAVPRLVKRSLDEADKERPRGVAAFFKQRYEDTGAARPIPPIVWISLVFSITPLFVPVESLLLIATLGVGLIFGMIARRRIKTSNGTIGGLGWANIAIALNTLMLIRFLTSALLWLWLSRG